MFGWVFLPPSTTNPPFWKIAVPTPVLWALPMVSASCCVVVFMLKSLVRAVAMASENWVPEPKPMWGGIEALTCRCTLPLTGCVAKNRFISAVASSVCVPVIWVFSACWACMITFGLFMPTPKPPNILPKSPLRSIKPRCSRAGVLM